MRHKYETHGIVIARAPLGEANALLTILTHELGLLRVRAQGIRGSGAKLASALVTFAESSLIVVRGKEGWRIVGAVLDRQWFGDIADAEARMAAMRVSGLLLRLVAGETSDPALYEVFRSFVSALQCAPNHVVESIEMLAVLRILRILGFDEGDIPGEMTSFEADVLSTIQDSYPSYISRINRGISASGL